MKFKTKMQSRTMTIGHSMGFTLIELLVAVALIAVVVPVIYRGLRIATLAGEVSQRKALAARIAEKVLNEAIVTGTTQTTTSGTEMAGPYQFRWTLKDEPWDQFSTLQIGSFPNSVNQGVVNSTLIHQLSVDVNYGAQDKTFNVHLSTLINTAPPQ